MAAAALALVGFHVSWAVTEFGTLHTYQLPFVLEMVLQDVVIERTGFLVDAARIAFRLVLTFVARPAHGCRGRKGPCRPHPRATLRTCCGAVPAPGEGMLATAVRERKTLEWLRALAEVALEACGIGHAAGADALAVLVPAAAPILQCHWLLALPTQENREISAEDAGNADRA